MTRAAAARRLRDLGPGAAPAIPQLIAALGDPLAQVAMDAGDALGRIGKPAVPPLIRALKSSDPSVRAWAAYAVRKVGPEARDAMPALAGLLRDDRTAAAAAQSLSVMGAPAVPALLEGLRNGSPLLREKAASALGDIGLGAETALPELRKLAEDDEPSAIRKAAKEAIGKIAAE
jgi:HEAT repeat protein